MAGVCNPLSALSVQQGIDFACEHTSRFGVMHVRLEHDASLLVNQRSVGRAFHPVVLLGPLPIGLQRHESDAERGHHWSHQTLLLGFHVDRKHSKAAVPIHLEHPL